MSRLQRINIATMSHCIPEEPNTSPTSSAPSLTYSSSEEPDNDLVEVPLPQRRRSSTVLLSQDLEDVGRILGESGTKLIEKCCGGGCMSISKNDGLTFAPVPLPDNDAFRSLQLKIGPIPTTLSGLVDLPPQTVSLIPAETASLLLPNKSVTTSSVDNGSIDLTSYTTNEEPAKLDTSIHPPSFVQPHAPYDVYSAKIFSARELTKPEAVKRTWHVELDVSSYPDVEGVDFKVGGAIGILAPNHPDMVEELLDLLAVPFSLRDRQVLVKTTGGRWPTVWGEEEPRELVSTRRALIQWCSDLQSYAPTKPLLRLLAEYAKYENEKRILEYLCSAEGQGSFCDLRTFSYITINQLLHAFPSSKPPLDHLLSVLPSLMPRFYSLSNDPHESHVPKSGCSRVIEIAVTLHQIQNWDGGLRSGVGSGFLQRQALAFIDAGKRGETIDLRVPMFKGLMANPLAKEFTSDGPMLLIGAGVGIAPFRGFVQRRLKSANCTNKVWVLQGVRDSLVDELYGGEWGVHEDDVKKVVESRRGKGRYVQDEVRAQADIVWLVAEALDGRVCVCGSSSGMADGVEAALVDAAMQKGNMSRAEAEEFWRLKKEAGQYIKETW